MKALKMIGLVAVIGMLGGCVSAATSAKVCADLGLVGKTVSVVSPGAGQAIAEWTPKKCGNVGVAGDAGKLTGGVTAGISNE